MQMHPRFSWRRQLGDSVEGADVLITILFTSAGHGRVLCRGAGQERRDAAARVSRRQPQVGAQGNDGCYYAMRLLPSAIEALRRPFADGGLGHRHPFCTHTRERLLLAHPVVLLPSPALTQAALGGPPRSGTAPAVRSRAPAPWKPPRRLPHWRWLPPRRRWQRWSAGRTPRPLRQRSARAPLRTRSWRSCVTHPTKCAAARFNCVRFASRFDRIRTCSTIFLHRPAQ